MMSDILSFREMILSLWRGETMDITVVKYDTSRKKGGDIRQYKNIRLNISKERENTTPRGESEDIRLSNNLFYKPKPYVNIILPNNELRKIYKVGIIRANNKPVQI